MIGGGVLERPGTEYMGLANPAGCGVLAWLNASYGSYTSPTLSTPTGTVP